LDIEIEGIAELFYKHASEEQLLYLDNANKLIYKEFNCLISFKLSIQI